MFICRLLLLFQKMRFQICQLSPLINEIDEGKITSEWFAVSTIFDFVKPIKSFEALENS